MEIFLEQLQEAKRTLKIADHLTYVTFPLMNDDKIITMIIDNLYISLNNSINALLNYEKYYKRVVNIPDTFENRYYIFKSELSKRYNINNDTVLIIKEIFDIFDKKKKSKSQIIEKDVFVSFTDQHKFRTLNLKRIKEYINVTKLFISKLNSIIEKNA